MRKIFCLSLSLSALLLSGCVQTPYERPAITYPAAYPHASGAEATALSGKWWTDFSDPQLDALMERVLERNHDLAAATYRLEQARASAGVARWDSLPTLSGSVGAERPLNSSSGNDDTSYSARLSVSYEADLWGRVRASRNAAEWQANASAEDIEAARLSLTGSAATLYWQVAYTNQQLASGRESLAYAQKTYDLVRAQYDNGAASGIEMAEALQTLNAEKNTLSQLTQKQVEYRASLALLLGGEAWPQAQEPQVLPQAVLSDLQAGLPADLLGRRPDLRAAENRLRAALAGVDATRAAMYPALTLTASGNGSSPQLSEVLSDPVGTLGAGLTLPFLNYPQNRLTVAASKAGYKASVSEFRQTLLQALTEVDNSLSAGQKLAQQGQYLSETLDAAKKTESLYALRYREGAVTLRVWLDAQERLRTARLNYDNNRLAQMTNRVALYQALGGGTR